MDKTQLGLAARALLVMPEFKQLVEQMRTEIGRRILTTGPLDKEQREELYLRGQGLNAFQRQLEIYVTALEIDEEAPAYE